MNVVKLELDGKSLNQNNIYAVAFAKECEVSLSERAKKQVLVANEYVKKIVEKEKPVYGINTGFGILSDKFIAKGDLRELQYNLVRSHCVGVGPAYSTPVARAMLLLRANCLLSGHSGVSYSVVELIIEFLNKQITPQIPQRGSVGASGDLAPLAHLALTLIGEGNVEYGGTVMETAKALQKAGLKPAELGPKDGLALINGTATMAAMGSLAVERARKLYLHADIAGALSVDALRGTVVAFDDKISQLKPHPGQLAVAKNLRKLLSASQILSSHHDCKRVQDPYSLRCMPQVHGACRQTYKHVAEVLDIEFNSVTDNPLVFEKQAQVISGGNFHGEALSLAMDYLAMGLTELSSICERRIEKLINPQFSELPTFLSPNPGLNSGLMMAHVTAAALVSESKTLCHPASVDSIPTNNDKEDHVSMGVNAGLKLQQVLDNVTHCLAIEFLCNTQALEFLRPLKSSPVLERVYELIRTKVDPIESDRIFSTDIDAITELIETDQILDVIGIDLS